MDHEDETKPRKERSPSFPFISLRKAIERVEAFYNGHRREPTRFPALAQTWGYSPSSSGLQQTVAALKQYGLLEEEGSGPERKVRVSDLARRIIADLRPGAQAEAIREAAKRPRLFQEYYPRWLPFRPSDAHCVSELHFERGFNEASARLFLKVFDDTADFAGLRQSDTMGESEVASESVSSPDETPERDDQEDGGWKPLVPPPVVRDAGERPLSERLQVVTTGNQLTVSAALVSGKEVEKLIRILRANMELLDDQDEEEDGSDLA